MKDKRSGERIDVIKEEIKLSTGSKRLFGEEVATKKYISTSTMKKKLKSKYNVTKILNFFSNIVKKNTMVFLFGENSDKRMVAF